ncbi:serine hydrolase [Streptomyces sp. NPDC088755]|uniref:serine hydrolase n=1 Tax=Streptomyces sp. NPDC088755 TaxID=3365888 RepID=UPI00381850B5
MLSAGRRRGTAAAVLTSAAIASLLVPQPTLAAPHAAPRHTVVCDARTDKGLAARLTRELTRDQQGYLGTLSFAIKDRRTGLVCTQSPDRQYDSASVVKLTIMGTVLRRSQELERPLTESERTDLRLMITASDNSAATRLWNSVGQTRLQQFLNLAGMTNTVLGSSWGLTQINARDEMRQLDVYTVNPTVLTAPNKLYARQLMSEVIPSQRWGAPYGAPDGVRVENKNGWLQRATHGWRVHSTGIFSSSDDLYQMVFLSDDDPTKSYGVNAIQKLAYRVHANLNEVPGHENGTTPAYQEDSYQGPEDSDRSEVESGQPPAEVATVGLKPTG